MKTKKLTILLVDDFELPRRLIRGMLDEMKFENGISIFEAGDGVDALNILKREKVDLIICDWVMPKMNGFELLQEVRKTPELTKLPFIMVTAEADKSNIMDAIRAGVSQYIIKPFTTAGLQKKITTVMEIG